MAEETVVAAPSAAEAPPSLDIPRSGTQEYAEWRVSGELPEVTPKPAAAATAATPSEPAGAPEPPKKLQERRKPDAEHRIKQLNDETKRLRAEIETLRTPKLEAQPQPKVSAPQEPTVEDKNPDGTPKYKTYEEFVKAQARWEARQELAEYQRQQQTQAQRAEVAKKVEAAKARYRNFDEISLPFVKTFVDAADIPMPVKIMVSESEVWPDLVFTIASDPKATADFLAMAKANPGKALRYIAKVESLIEEELSTPSPGRNAKGEFTAAVSDPPAKRGPESAPEPPIQIGNRATGTMDESERAFSAIERGDNNAVRAFLKAENAKDLRRRRGQ